MFESLYTDDANPIAARKYPGCFTVDEVRQHLGQSSKCSPTGEETLKLERKQVTLDDHWAANCVCDHIHSRCTGPEPKPSSNEVVDMTIDQLHAAAQSGCWFCTVIYETIIAMPAWDPAWPMPIGTHIRLYNTESGLLMRRLGSTGEIGEPKVLFYVDGNQASSSPCKALQVRKESVYADPHAQLNFASRALRRCLEDHSCVPVTTSFMPTRLVQVRVDNGVYAVRIVEGVRPQPYVTLSHCWGSCFPANAKTTGSNIQSRKSSLGVPWEELPQAFQDAIAVTEQLGFEYIWIDALCVIQDSPSDWEVESSLMSEVYSCCAFMISADASPDSNMGLFRSANMSTRPWVGAAAKSASWSDGTIKARFSVMHFTYWKTGKTLVPFDQFHIFPLSTRAWCYQEGRLAKRVVHFSVDEISYDCVEGVECQCGAYGLEGESYGVSRWVKSLPEQECTAQEKEVLWHDTVCTYSGRKLSLWADRLPALSGLARQFQASNKSSGSCASAGGQEFSADTKRQFKTIDLGAYMAGLWSKSLSADLCWLAANESGDRISTATEYIAPTWSWASVSSPVSFPKAGGVQANIITARCCPAGADEFGKCTSGEVTLKAKIVSVRLFQEFWNLPFMDDGKFWNIRLECRDPVTGEDSCLPYRPDHIQPTTEAGFWGGLVRQFTWPELSPEKLLRLGDGDYFALLLRTSFVMVIRSVQHGQSDVYERVGAVYSDHNGTIDDQTRWFDGVEEQILTIV